jgi:hypothetical protein
MTTPIEVPVLVAGGSLVGLSSALFLGHFVLNPIWNHRFGGRC